MLKHLKCMYQVLFIYKYLPVCRLKTNGNLVVEFIENSQMMHVACDIDENYRYLLCYFDEWKSLCRHEKEMIHGQIPVCKVTIFVVIVPVIFFVVPGTA